MSQSALMSVRPAKSVDCAEDPNVVLFGGRVSQLTMGKNNQGLPKAMAKVVNESSMGARFNTVLSVTAHNKNARKLAELYESGSYCLLQGRMASDKTGLVFLIPDRVFDAGAD